MIPPRFIYYMLNFKKYQCFWDFFSNCVDVLFFTIIEVVLYSEVFSKFWKIILIPLDPLVALYFLYDSSMYHLLLHMHFVIIPFRYLLYVDFLYSFWLYYKLWRNVAMDIIKVFGSNLKKYRTAIGISQEAFAEKCGMHRTYISAIECYRRSISLENIQRIADALGIETYRLFLEDNKKWKSW